MNKRTNTRSHAVIERNFIAAIERILAGRPRHPKLRRQARASISFSSVALEAGHSRTLIALKDSAFAAIRDRILALRISDGKTAGPSRRVRLEEKNAELRRRLTEALSTVLAVQRKCESLELKLRHAQRVFPQPIEPPGVPY